MSRIALSNSCSMFIPCIYLGVEESFAVESNSTSQGLPYQIYSLMHFSHNSFAFSPLLSTITPKDTLVPLELLGKSTTALRLDFLHINLLYCGGIFEVNNIL